MRLFIQNLFFLFLRVRKKLSSFSGSTAYYFIRKYFLFGILCFPLFILLTHLFHIFIFELFPFTPPQIPWGIFFEFFVFWIVLLFLTKKQQKPLVWKILSFGALFSLFFGIHLVLTKFSSPLFGFLLTIKLFYIFSFVRIRIFLGILFPLSMGILFLIPIFQNFLPHNIYENGAILLLLSFGSWFYQKKYFKKIPLLSSPHPENFGHLYQMAEFGTLTSGFFHDIVNPVTAVSLNLEYLKNKQQNIHPELNTYVDQAVGATQKLEQYIKTMHKQIQNHDEKVTFLLSQEIYEAIAILNHKAYKQNVSIIFQKNTPIYYYGDMAKFHQIVVNLLSNAIDAYDGLIEPDKKVFIELYKQERTVQLVVKDFGIGIKPQDKPYIFDPLFTTKPSPKGLGIGLCMVKYRVQKDLQGNIEVSDTLPHGTTFTVKFEMCEEHES